MPNYPPRVLPEITLFHNGIMSIVHDCYKTCILSHSCHRGQPDIGIWSIGARPDVIMAQVAAAFIGVRKSKIMVSPMTSHIADAICQAGIGDKYS